MTGDGVIYGDDLAWKFWGDINIFGQSISISKEDAAFVPIDDGSGSGGLLALYDTEKTPWGVETLTTYSALTLFKGCREIPLESKGEVCRKQLFKK